LALEQRGEIKTTRKSGGAQGTLIASRMLFTLNAVIPIAGNECQRVRDPGAVHMPFAVGENSFTHFSIAAMIHQVEMIRHCFPVNRISAQIHRTREKQHEVYDANTKYHKADPAFYPVVHCMKR
jgi:hypothetical protein